MAQACLHVYACSAWCLMHMHSVVSDAAHMTLVGLAALVVVLVCGACVNWTASCLCCIPNIATRRGSKYSHSSDYNAQSCWGSGRH